MTVRSIIDRLRKWVRRPPHRERSWSKRRVLSLLVLEGRTVPSVTPLAPPADFAPVLVSPGGAARVMADQSSLVIAQLRLGHLEGPLRFAIGAPPADVDLYACRMRSQHDILAGQGFDRLRNLGRSEGLGVCQGSKCHERRWRRRSQPRQSRDQGLLLLKTAH